MPHFIAAAALQAGRAGRLSATDWVHEIKLDGYRMQLRVAGRRGRHAHAQGPRLDGQICRHRGSCAPACPTASSTARSSRSITMARRISRRCRRRSPKDARSDLTYFVFDLLFEDGEDLRRLPLTERKERLTAAAWAQRQRTRQQIKYVEHLAEPGDAVLQVRLQAQSRRHHLESARARPTNPAAPKPG